MHVAHVRAGVTETWQGVSGGGERAWQCRGSTTHLPAAIICHRGSTLRGVWAEQTATGRHARAALAHRHPPPHRTDWHVGDRGAAAVAQRCGVRGLAVFCFVVVVARVPSSGSRRDGRRRVRGSSSVRVARVVGTCVRPLVAHNVSCMYVHMDMDMDMDRVNRARAQWRQ